MLIGDRLEIVRTATVCDIENGPVEIVDIANENGGSFHSYVDQPWFLIGKPYN
jgi:hypothetical protein